MGALRPAPASPRAHLLVCVNRRPDDDPLGGGCGARGEVVYAAVKREIAARRAVLSVWATRTHCLGVCPRDGAAVALHPPGEFLAGALPADAGALLDRTLSVSGARAPAKEAELLGAFDAKLASMEEVQAARVVELARRILPHLTAEDVRNPHDFPELDDPDWHYEDGQLTALQGVRFALRALIRDGSVDGDAAYSIDPRSGPGDEGPGTKRGG